MTADQIKTKIRETTGTTSDDWSDASLIRDLNHELSMIQIKILYERGVLEFDDPNYPDLPFSTFPITAGTRVYKITEDDNGAQILSKHKLAVMKDGKFHDVPRIQVAEGKQEALLTETTDTSDLPSGYFESGDNIIFKQYPASSTTGKVWFDREISFLTVDDTTKVPGVPSQYHQLAAYRTSYGYAIDNDLPNENNILRRIQKEESELGIFEENRRVDEATNITVPSKQGL